MKYIKVKGGIRLVMSCRDMYCGLCYKREKCDMDKFKVYYKASNIVMSRVITKGKAVKHETKRG